MNSFFKSSLFQRNPKFKKILGIVFIVIGTIALITPFTPGSWLIPVGLQLLGVGVLAKDGVKKKTPSNEEGSRSGE